MQDNLKIRREVSVHVGLHHRITDAVGLEPQLTSPREGARTDERECLVACCETIRVDAAKIDDVRSGEILDQVPVFRAGQAFGHRGEHEGVSPCASPEYIAAGTTAEIIVAAATCQAVVPGLAIKAIVARAAAEGVIPTITNELVVTTVACNGIVELVSAAAQIVPTTQEELLDAGQFGATSEIEAHQALYPVNAAGTADIRVEHAIKATVDPVDVVSFSAAHAIVAEAAIQQIVA
nr:hypothetical protein [Microvirga aerophila]